MRGNLMTCILAAACAFLAIAIVLEPRSMPPPVAAGPIMTVGTNGPMTLPVDRVDELLDRKISTLDVYPSMPLKEALGAIAKAGQIEVQVNWSALEAATIDAVAPVNIEGPLHDLSVRDALQQILQNVSLPLPNIIAFQVRDGKVVISNTDDLAGYCIVVIYNIRDLLDDFVAQANSPGGVRAGKTPMVMQEAIDDLASLIKNTVDGGSWMENGGAIGSIREMMGLMIVAQTPENQHDIAVLLDTLRDCRGLPRAGSAAVLLSKSARPGPVGGLF